MSFLDDARKKREEYVASEAKKSADAYNAIIRDLRDNRQKHLDEVRKIIIDELTEYVVREGEISGFNISWHKTYEAKDLTRNNILGIHLAVQGIMRTVWLALVGELGVEDRLRSYEVPKLFLGEETGDYIRKSGYEITSEVHTAYDDDSYGGNGNRQTFVATVSGRFTPPLT